MSFQAQLNPALWDNKTLRPEVRSQLLIIAKYFQEKFEITQKPYDIYFTGSLANYNYNESSDIDLHFVYDYEDLGDFDFIEDYFKAKKETFNSEHDIFIKGYPVEIGTEDIDTPLESTGIYSVKNDEWVIEPQPITAQVEDVTTTESWIKLLTEIKNVLKRNDLEETKELWDNIKEMRKTGLKLGGELHPYNLLFKELRRAGVIQVLKTRLTKLTDNSLSLNETRFFNSETHQWEDEDDEDNDKTWTSNSDWAEFNKKQAEIAKKTEDQKQAEIAKRKQAKLNSKKNKLEKIKADYLHFLKTKATLSADECIQRSEEFGKMMKRDPNLAAELNAIRFNFETKKNEAVEILKKRF